MIERHPLKKILSSDEVAKMASFLISEDASSISGQIFNMDAGIVTFKSWYHDKNNQNNISSHVFNF